MHTLIQEALAALGPDCKPRFLGGGEEMFRSLGRAEGDLLFVDLDIPGSEACLAEVARLRSAIPVVGVGTEPQPDVAGFEVRFPQRYFPMMTYLRKPLALDALILAFQGEIRQLARGVIEGLSLPSLLQMLNIERKTCTIRVISGRRVGFFYMQGGELINARFRRVEGLEAAVRLLAADSPRAEIQSQLHDSTRRIQGRLEEVLMEAMQFKDEDTDHRNAQPASQDEVEDDALPESETGKWHFDADRKGPVLPRKRRLLLPILAACGLLGVVALAALPFRKVSIRVQSVPAGATLSLDGQRLGSAPMLMKVPRPLRGTIRAEAVGYAPLIRELKDGDKELDLVLEPLPKPPPPVAEADPEPEPEPEEPPASRTPRVRQKRKPTRQASPPPARAGRRGDVFDQVR
ncbi:DUF4388 domain-containing protein [Holophaga foetida]|uniref:DUF4388 domain-containing protein n=1 Tax=Holophaga foetida TaxID=35839 RepID=UPI000247537F|nr:DUF4388 domain-containing protein [Holophaga foetida]